MHRDSLKVILALVLIFGVIPSAGAHDIIANGDFHDGKTHWQGDGDAPDTGGKIVITLKPDKWTVLTQKFSDNSRHLQLKLTYSFSDDCTLTRKRDPGSITPALTAEGLRQATGLETRMSDYSLSYTAEFMVLIVSGGYVYDETQVYNNASPYSNSASTTDANGMRTFTSSLSQWEGYDNESICICFPPGTGSVTITNVALIPPPSSD